MLKASTSFALDVLQQPLALLKSSSAEDAQSIAEGILNAPVSGIAAQRHISLKLHSAVSVHRPAPDDFPPIRYKLVEKPLNQKEQLYKILCSYRSLLANWRIAYAPRNPEELMHPCFVASLHYADRVQYLLDILLQGSPNEKQQLLNGKEVTALGKAIERCKETEEAA